MSISSVKMPWHLWCNSKVEIKVCILTFITSRQVIFEGNKNRIQLEFLSPFEGFFGTGGWLTKSLYIYIYIHRERERDINDITQLLLTMVHGVFASNSVLGVICSEAACLPLFILKPQPTTVSEKKMSWFIIYIIYDTNMRPSFILTSKDSSEVFMLFFYYVFIYSVYYIHLYTPCMPYTATPPCLVRAYPSRCTLPCKTYHWRWGHLAALLMIQKSQNHHRKDV